MDTVYYDVSGVTTEEIFDSIRANGPDYDVGIESKFASGLTHAEPSYQLEFLDKATSCSIRSVGIDLTLVVTLPRHTDLSVLGEPQLSRWLKRANDVVAHETCHVAIHIERIEAFKQRVEDVPTEFPDCDSLKSSLALAWARERTLNGEAQDAFHQSEEQLSRSLRGPVQAQIDQSEAELEQLQDRVDSLSSEIEEFRVQIAEIDGLMQPYDTQMSAIQFQYPDLLLPRRIFSEYEQLLADWSELNDLRNTLIGLMNSLVGQHNRTIEEFNQLTEQTNKLNEELAWLP